MSVPAEKLSFDGAAYLAWEAEQEERHEFIAGETFAMSGGTDAHATITLNLAIALRSHMRGSPCRVFMNTMKLRVEASDAYFYPDAFVTCAETDRNNGDAKHSAVFIAEILSPSTSAFDRGRKFEHYRKLPDLREYLLVDTERMAADLFRKDATGHWVLYPYAENETIELASIGLDIPVAALYDEVLWEGAREDRSPRPGP